MNRGRKYEVGIVVVQVLFNRGMSSDSYQEERIEE